MAIYPLIIAPDERLNTKSSPVEKVDDEIRTLAADMLETMYHSQGIGLAAVQVGVLKRILVADVTWNKEKDSGEQHVLINPEIVENSEEKNRYKEGCLSFPEQYADVTRPSGVTVRFLDTEGNPQETTYDGLLATCIQHEIDHLNGVVFVDHTSSLKRDIILRRLKKMKKQGAFDHDHSHDHVHGEHCDHDHRL